MLEPTAVHLIFFFGHWVELHCALTKFMAQFFSDDASNIVNFYKSFLFFKTFHILEFVSRSKLSIYKILGMRKIRNVPPKNIFFSFDLFEKARDMKTFEKQQTCRVPLFYSPLSVLSPQLTSN